MKFIFILTISFTFAQLPPFYHLSSEIRYKTEEILNKCPKSKISSLSYSPDLDLITINEGENKQQKGFVIFGEHARELITAETGLQFLQTLCDTKIENSHRDKILKDYELRMILNVNPISRSKVEMGSFCLRENENGVDLNRNYNAHWNEVNDQRLKHVSPGPFAFSERETQIVSDQLKQFQPTVFFSIHSGTLGLYSPYAYKQDIAEENKENNIKILSEIQSKHCPQCKVGSCGKEVGYLAPGTSMDYAFDELKIRYSYTFEIYNKEVDLSKNTERKSFLQKQETTKISQINQRQKEQELDQVLRSHSCFAELATSEMTDEQCLQYFNPLNEDQFKYYIQNWSNAILLGLNMVTDLEQNQTK